MPRDLLLLQRRPLCERRVFPSGKLLVTRLDLLLQPRLFCERASLWAKPRVRQPLKEMLRSPLRRPSSRLSYGPVLLAPSLVIRPDWATDLAQYKIRRSRLHKAE